MASISTLGVGSGLQLGDILDSLTAAQKAQLTPISKQQTSYTAKLSAYGTLKVHWNPSRRQIPHLAKPICLQRLPPPAAAQPSVPQPAAARLRVNTPLTYRSLRRRKP